MMFLGLPIELAIKKLAGAPYRVRRLDNYWLSTGDWRVIKEEIQDGVTVFTVTLFRCIDHPS